MTFTPEERAEQRAERRMKSLLRAWINASVKLPTASHEWRKIYDREIAEIKQELGVNELTEVMNPDGTLKQKFTPEQRTKRLAKLTDEQIGGHLRNWIRAQTKLQGPEPRHMRALYYREIAEAKATLGLNADTKLTDILNRDGSIKPGALR